MESLRIFAITMVSVACIGYAGTFSQADAGGQSARDLAASIGTVDIDGARLTGQLVEHDGRTELLLTAHNPTAEKVELRFQYAAYYTAPAPMYSRMGAFPQQVAGEECLLVADAGETVSKRVPLKDLPPGAGKAEEMEDWSKEMWSLIVSRDAIDEGGMWGAVPPPANEDAVALAAQPIVLASSVAG